MGTNHSRLAKKSVPAGYFLFREEYFRLGDNYALFRFLKLITAREQRAGAPLKSYGDFVRNHDFNNLSFREGVVRVPYEKWGVSGLTRLLITIAHSKEKLERAISFLLTPKKEKETLLKKFRNLKKKFEEKRGAELSYWDMRALLAFKEVEKSAVRTPSLEDKLLLWEMFLTFFGKELREEGPDKYQQRLVLARFFRDDRELAREAKNSGMTSSEKEAEMLKTISATLSELRSLEFSPVTSVTRYPKKIRDILLEVSPFRLLDEDLVGQYEGLLSYIESRRLKKK